VDSCWIKYEYTASYLCNGDTYVVEMMPHKARTTGINFAKRQTTITAAASTRVLVTFHFRLQFLQSIGELLEFTETWGFVVSFCPVASLEINLNLYMYIRACSKTWPFGPQVRWPTTRSSSLAACIKVLPVLTSTRVENYLLAAALTTTLTRSDFETGKVITKRLFAH